MSPEVVGFAIVLLAAVMLIGKAAPDLRAALSNTGAELVDCPSLEAAVAQSASRARTGEVVLLSPACASQDMFRDYEERGDRFAGAVRALSERVGSSHA